MLLEGASVGSNALETVLQHLLGPLAKETSETTNGKPIHCPLELGLHFRVRRFESVVRTHTVSKRYDGLKFMLNKIMLRSSLVTVTQDDSGILLNFPKQETLGRRDL